MMLALGIALLVVGVVTLAVIRARWQRWGFADEMAKLDAAAQDMKAEMAAPFLPVVERLSKALAKVR